MEDIKQNTPSDKTNMPAGLTPPDTAQPKAQTIPTEEKLKLENQFANGANWFFWIAGLSLINSIVLLSGGTWAFIIGLGITQVIDNILIATEIGTAGIVIALVLDVFIAGIVVTFGVLARKKFTWAFIVGMALYALDGLFFLIVQDWLSIGFHIFALFGLYSGLKAMNKLRQIQ